MSYYRKPKYYSKSYPQQIEGTFQMTFTENRIFKNNDYKRTHNTIIGLDVAGENKSKKLLYHSRILRINSDNKKFHSYTPTFDESQYDYFLDGFFDATDEEKIMFGLTFNNLSAYDMCLDAFNEAEAFYASHAQ